MGDINVRWRWSHTPWPVFPNYPAVWGIRDIDIDQPTQPDILVELFKFFENYIQWTFKSVDDDFQMRTF